jgi:hypothetical protein
VKLRREEKREGDQETARGTIQPIVGCEVGRKFPTSNSQLPN